MEGGRNKQSLGPAAIPFLTLALEKYLPVCPRKQHGYPCSVQNDRGERLKEPWCDWTMEHVGKAEKILDLLHSIFPKSLLGVKSKLWKDVRYDYHFIKSDKYYIHV